MNTILTWIWSNAWELIALFAVIRYGKILGKILLFDPLAGGNGKVQMDELAKFLILIVFVWWAYIEATRTVEHHIISDTQFMAVLGAVCIIAGIKYYFNNKKDDAQQ